MSENKIALRSEISDYLFDPSRYKSHASLESPHGTPILSSDRDYITIWGYWNGPDDALAAKDEVIYDGIDALAALDGAALSRGARIQEA